jgi:hypothetical protein
MSNQELTIKRNPAVTSDQPDAGVAAVKQEIAPLLPGPVSAAQLATALAPHHGTVQLRPVGVWYEEIMDPITGKWITICHDLAIVTVTDSQLERPIEVAVDDRMPA